MSTIPQSDRGMWNVSKQSFHYRLYMKWFSLSFKGPLQNGNPINLCHYMRVVMIWVWMRLFFVQNISPFGWLYITPAATLVILSIIGAITWATVAYIAVAAVVWQYIGMAVGIAVVAVAFIAALTYWHDASRETFLTFCDGITWPFRKIRQFFKHVGNKMEPKLEVMIEGIIDAGEWFFSTRYKFLYLWFIIPAAILAGLFSIGTNVGYIALMVVGSLAGLVMIIVACILLGEEVVGPWLRVKAANRPATAETPKEPRPPSQFKEFMRLIWQFIVAKKMKICPLIVPEDGRTTS